MISGWTGRILRLDLSNRKSSVGPVEPYIKSFITLEGALKSVKIKDG